MGAGVRGVVSKSVYALRQQLPQWWGVMVAVAFAGLLWLGWFSGSGVWAGDVLTLMGLGVYTVTLARALVRELNPQAAGVSRMLATLRELELGCLLIVGAFVLISATGGVRSFLYPLVYALVSFLLVVHRHRLVAYVWVAMAVGLEIVVGHASAPGRWAIVAYHCTFIVFFAVGNLLILGSLARRLRGEHGRQVTAELARIRQEASDFRLIASQLPLDSRPARSREEEELRMAQGAVHAVHEQLFFTVDMLCSSLRLHSCAILWVDSPAAAGNDGRATPTLTIKELSTASEFVRDTPKIESAGILTAVLRDPKPLRLKALAGKRRPPYYSGPEQVTDICCVPLMEGQALRGLLCADRITDRPFGDDEEAVLVKAAQHVLRIVEQERSFARVERSKYEQEQFYKASEALNEALTLTEVLDQTFEAITAMCPSELMVLTSYSDGMHEVLAHRVDPDCAHPKTWGRVVASLDALRFRHGKGLVSCAVKNRIPMPAAAGQAFDTDCVVFDEQTLLKKAKSVLVLPLIRGEEVLGTIVLASSRPGQYPTQTREMLRVIANQVSVSVQNARMYQAMEERATTDGLTGLTNHRAFQERYEHLHALAERTDQRFSVILTDIDHFKSVNDTYGHPVGDAVLRRVAAIFAGRARKVDLVARYGGEEFVLVLPDTDGPGAELFANRLREEVAAQAMTSDNGNFNVTISMGIASFPDDGASRSELVEKADQALYYCKEHGRNRVTRFATMGTRS